MRKVIIKKTPSQQTANNTYQGDYQQYGDGGKVKPPIYTTDKKKVQAYNDSLNLYNAYRKQDELMGKGSNLQESGPGNWSMETLKNRRTPHILKGDSKAYADDFQSEKEQFQDGYDFTARKEDKKLIDYYKSLPFNEKVDIMYHVSPDLIHSTIKPTGTYFDGTAASPVYKQPVQPYIQRSNQNIQQLPISDPNQLGTSQGQYIPEEVPVSIPRMGGNNYSQQYLGRNYINGQEDIPRNTMYRQGGIYQGAYQQWEHGGQVPHMDIGGGLLPVAYTSPDAGLPPVSTPAYIPQREAAPPTAHPGLQKFMGRQGDIATSTNNPGNMKFAPWQQQFGATPSGIPGKDGGEFAAFPDVDKGLAAYKLQLFGDTDGHFKSRYYKSSTPVAEALKKWSNGGYGADIYPEIKNKTLGQLTPEQRDELVKRQIKRESPTMFQQLHKKGYYKEGGLYTGGPEFEKMLQEAGYEYQLV